MSFECVKGYIGKTKYVKSKYKYVQNLQKNGVDWWTFNIRGVKKKRFETERDAAIAVDIYFIKKGREPLNILKKK